MNVVTKSGTNQCHGSVYGFYRPAGAEASRNQLLNAPNAVLNTASAQNSDIGATLGGPLVKDKIFFFGAFNPRWTTVTRFATGEGLPLAGQEIDRNRRNLSYAAKLTWQASGNHRFDVSAFGDASRGEAGPQRGTALLADVLRTSALEYGGNNLIAKYDGILSPHWFIEGSVSQMRNDITELPAMDEWSVTDTTVTPFRRSGGIGFYENSESKSLQYRLTSTNIFNAGGQHRVRYGVQYEDIEYNTNRLRTGPPVTLSDGQMTTSGVPLTVIATNDVPAGQIWRASRGFLSAGRDTTQKYTSFFLQDTWQVSNRLTLKLGVRYEKQTLRGGEAEPLCSEGESAPGANDGPNPSTVPCQYTWDNNFAPRLGFVFDVTGDGRSKLFAHYGKYYAKIPNDLAVRAMSGDAGITRQDFYDAALTMPIPHGVLANGTTTHLIFSGAGAALFGTGADAPKQTYKDECVGGFELEAFEGVNLGVRYTYRDMPRVTEDIGVVALSTWITDPDVFASINYFMTNPTPASPVTLPDDGSVKFESPVHHYHAVEVTANRVFRDGWGLVASYRWSKLTGTFEGFFRNDNGQSDPAITSLFDFPTDDPTYLQQSEEFDLGFRGDIRNQGNQGAGFLPNDRTHQFKIWGSTTMGDFNVGIGLGAGSGAPLTVMAANPAYDNSGEIPEGSRGSGIETVDGFKKRTNWRTTLDVHVDYRFRIGDSQSITLIADAINMFNNQDASNYDYASESSFGVFNPNGPLSDPGGQPTLGDNGVSTAYFAPRQIRFGARFEF